MKRQKLSLGKKVAVICEGGAETAIMEMLLDADRLIFKEDDLFYDEIIRCRNAEKFEQRYLKVRLSYKLTIIRVLDSRRENFKLSRPYCDDIDVINVVTAPEIEMLIILNEGKYDQFKKSGKKPSEYCKQIFKNENIKSRTWVKEYFKNIDDLIQSIRMYDRVSDVRMGEYTLLDLLKN